MKRDGTPTRFMDVVYLRTRSFRSTWRVTEFVLLWAILLQDGLTDLTTEKVAAEFDMNERTAYRRLTEFREAFPEEDTPDRIAQLIADEIDRKLKSSDAMALPSPAELVAA